MPLSHRHAGNRDIAQSEAFCARDPLADGVHGRPGGGGETRETAHRERATPQTDWRGDRLSNCAF